MGGLDIPDGPKTPAGTQRIALIAVISVFFIVSGHVFGIPYLDEIGEFALEHLFLMGSIAGLVLFLIAVYRWI